VDSLHTRSISETNSLLPEIIKFADGVHAVSACLPAPEAGIFLPESTCLTYIAALTHTLIGSCG
jgi:hypothetical protein